MRVRVRVRVRPRGDERAFEGGSNATKRDVRVPNARVRVCGTAVEDASSRIDATTRDVVDRTLARVGRPHGPTVGPGPPGCVDSFVSHDR